MKITISLPEDIIKWIDKEVKINYSSRSAIIRESVLLLMKGGKSK